MGLRDWILGHDPDQCQHQRGGKFCPDCRHLLQVPRYSFGELTGGNSKSAVWLEKAFRRTLIGLTFYPG